MNRRQRKKYNKKAAEREVAAAIKALWEFEPKGDEPCDDPKCDSCYVQEGAARYRFPGE